MFGNRFKSMIGGQADRLLKSKSKDKFVEVVANVSKNNDSTFIASGNSVFKVGTISSFDSSPNQLINDLLNNKTLRSIKPVKTFNLSE